MHAEQPDLGFVLAILTKEGADLAEDFGVELGAMIERMGAGDSGKVGVAELELQGSGKQFVFAKAAADHLGKPSQHGVQRFEIGGVFVECELVTDGFRVVFLAYDAVEPSSGVQAARFSGQRERPL